MLEVIFTLLTAFVINLAVLFALKVGLRRGSSTASHGWGGHTPCR